MNITEFNLPAYMNKLNHKQRIACELLASSPNMKDTEIAESIGVHPRTIFRYKSDPVFIDIVYKRFMEISGGRLINVVDAMIREAEKGNVQAGTLVLKHYGKLEDKITVKIESPFEKFLKMGNVEDAVVEREEDAKELVGASFEIKSDLPERDPINDQLKKRKRAENKAIKEIEEKGYKEAHRKKRRNKAYLLRKRAEKVGMKKLPGGRQRKNVGEQCMKELIEREKAMGVK